MTQDVQSRRRVDSTRHGASVEGIAYAERRLEIPVRNASLCSLGDEVEDGGASRLGTSAGRGGNGDQGQKSRSDGHAFAERGVDEVEEIILCATHSALRLCALCRVQHTRITVIQIHQLGGINDGSSSNCEESIWVVQLCKCNGLLDAEKGQVSRSCRLMCLKRYLRGVLGLDASL